jgi:hypothetical protein
MTTVPPPTAPPVPAAPAPAAAAVATVPTPPPPLLAVPPGVQLEALVLASDPALKAATVQTALGPLELKTAWPLPPAAKLVLQVALNAPTVQVLIVSIDGEPLTGHGSRPGATIPSAPPTALATPTPTTTPGDRIQVGAVLEATLLRAAPLASRAPAGPARTDAPAAQPSLAGADPARPLLARVAHLGATLGDKLAALPVKLASAIGAARPETSPAAAAAKSAGLAAPATAGPGGGAEAPSRATPPRHRRHGARQRLARGRPARAPAGTAPGAGARGDAHRHGRLLHPRPHHRRDRYRSGDPEYRRGAAQGPAPRARTRRSAAPARARR